MLGNEANYIYTDFIPGCPFQLQVWCAYTIGKNMQYLQTLPLRAFPLFIPKISELLLVREVVFCVENVLSIVNALSSLNADLVSNFLEQCPLL